MGGLISAQVQGHALDDAPAFRVHSDPEGKTIALLGPESKTDAQKQHSDVVKDLIANFFFPMQSDTVGPYSATFETLSPSRFSKKKIAYVGPSKPKPEIVSSQCTSAPGLTTRAASWCIATHNTDNGDGWEREGENHEYFHDLSEKRAYPLASTSFIT